jgi:hypothetical protein
MEERPEASLEEFEEYHFVANQTFRSEDEAYEFYNEYAKAKWFSIRKGKVRRSLDTDEMIWRKLLCSCEGYMDVQYFDRNDREREPRSLTRCGCCALMEVQWSTKTKIWYVKNFVDVYNHVLAKTEHVYVLWSHRGLNGAQKAEAIALSQSRLRSYQIMDVVQKSHVGLGDTGFLLQDLYNFIVRRRRIVFHIFLHHHEIAVEIRALEVSSSYFCITMHIPCIYYCTMTHTDKMAVRPK